MIVIDISPIAFTIGPLEVRWYGIMIALAVVVLVLWVLWEVRRGAKISYDTIFTSALVGIVFGIIFSRLLHVIDNIVAARLYPGLVESGAIIDYLKQPNLIIGASGLTIYGAILGATLAVWVYSRIARYRFGYLADTVAPGVILAQAVGRVGCTLNGCCYGMETSLPWAVLYTHPASACQAGVAVHPTQLYEIIFNLLVFGVLFKLRRRLRPDGSLFLVYLSLYSLWRLGIGFLREGTPFLFGLQQAQVIGIIVLLIAIPLIALRTRWVRSAGEPSQSQEQAG